MVPHGAKNAASFAREGTLVAHVDAPWRRKAEAGRPTVLNLPASADGDLDILLC